MKIKLFTLFILLIPIGTFGHTKYTILQYYKDKEIIDSVLIEVNSENYKVANRLIKLHKSKINSEKYYLKAKINYNLNKPFKNNLEKAIFLGYYYNDSSTFYLKNINFIEQKRQDFLDESKKSIPKKLFNDLVILDQKYREEGVEVGSEQDKALLVKFDSLVTIYGWPARHKYQFMGIGPVILLAHQDFKNAEGFMNYYYTVVKLCLDNKEDWQVARFILNQRYQWFGSKLRKQHIEYDTLCIPITKNENFNKELGLPFLYTISNKLSVNAHLKIEIQTATPYLKSQIRKYIYQFEDPISYPAEILEIFKSQGFSYQESIISDKRINVIVNSGLETNQFVYKFSNL